MSKCPDCGTENAEHNEFCTHCGASLSGPHLYSHTHASTSSPGSGSTIAAGGNEQSVELLQRELRDFRRHLLAHTSGLAGALSAILPGLGQIYAGSPGSGIPIMLAWVIGLLAYTTWCIRTLTRPRFGWEPSPTLTVGHVLVGLMIVVLWVFNILHAISVSETLQEGK